MSKGRRRASPNSRGRQRLFFAVGALIFGLLLFSRVQDESPERYAVLDLAEHPPGTATPYVPHNRRFPAFYLMHTREGQVYAISRLAPQSGCLVVWDESLELFEDPCDDERYDWTGSPAGQKGEGLEHLPLERSEIDRVIIDLSTRLPNPYNQNGS